MKRLDHRHQLRSAEGVPLVHVKPRTGAPYNAAAEDEALAHAVAEGVRDVDPGLVVVCLAGSPMVRVEPGAVVQDPQAVAERASRIARERTVVAVDGTTVRVAADTLCLHGDTPGAAVLAEAIRARLKVDGVEVRRLRFS